MTNNLPQDRFIRALHNSQNHSLARSCRRMLFNHCNDTDQAFHVDTVFGGGTGTLVKIEEKYFCLTAKHVITGNNVNLNNLQNDSFLWLPRDAAPPERELKLTDFLFPKKAWYIGELIGYNETHWPFTDFTDILLIELFAPFPPNLHPDCFIEITEADGNILTEQQYFETQLVTINGYPLNQNAYNYEDPPEGFTHATYIQRVSLVGQNKRHDGGWAIDTSIGESIPTHDNINGMSGGCLINVNVPENQLKWVGLIQAVDGQNMLRYIPSFILKPTLLNYSSARSTLIDPAANMFLNAEA